MQAAPSMKKAQLAIVKQRKSFPFLMLFLGLHWIAFHLNQQLYKH